MEWIFHLGVILLAAKIGADLFQRFGMSAVIGEIAVGVVLGESMFRVIPETELIRHLAELGVIFLIFLLGLETKIQHVREVGVSATLIALGGLVVPFGFGYGFGLVMNLGQQPSLLLGAVLMATSVAISTRVFLDCGMKRSRVTQTIIAAAVIDDVVGLMLLTVILALLGKGEGGIGLMLARQAALLLVGFPIAFYAIPKALRWIRRLQGEGATFAVVIGLTLLFAYGGVPAGMEPIIGAFLIGVIFGATKESVVIEERTTSLVHFLAPIFFVHVGLTIDVHALSDGVMLAIWLTLAAAASKVLGAGGLAKLRGLPTNEALLIGTGMVPRGEVGLIIAGIAARIGLFDERIYAAAALMCVLTVVIVPPALKPLARQFARTQERAGQGAGRPSKRTGE